jgi:hypothetical protein
MLIVAVRNNFNMLYGTGNGKDFGEHVLRDTGAQVSNVKMSTPLERRGVVARELMKQKISCTDQKIRDMERTGASAGPPIAIGFMIGKDERK